LHPPRDIETIDPGCLERGILHHRRQAMRYRIAKEDKEFCCGSEPHFSFQLSAFSYQPFPCLADG
jgi:hypothetical protein